MAAREVAALPRGSWVVVDEVQKLPALLSEVQDLLAGRVVNRHFFPLTAAELGARFDVANVLASSSAV